MEQVGANSEVEQVQVAEQVEETPDTWRGGQAMKPNTTRARVPMIPCTTYMATSFRVEAKIFVKDSS